MCADALTALAADATGARVALSSSEGHVALFRWDASHRVFARVWSTELAALPLTQPVPPHVLPVTGMLFSPSGSHLLSASADYTVAVWPTKPPPAWRAALPRLALAAALAVVVLAVVAARAAMPSRAALPPVVTPAPHSDRNPTVSPHKDASPPPARPDHRRRRRVGLW